ncbi:MAG: hypothetical protein M0Z76_07120 [Gammaproteobacteria bacterium]|nr:hypothetical protein [Gammaproteobacteria bacterium]
MRTSLDKQSGVSTLIMILAIGAALSAGLYGAYSHLQATNKVQDSSSNRTQARALAEDGVDLASAYLNSLYCGGTNITCTNGSASAVDPAAVPNNTVLANQTQANGTLSAAVLSNTFNTNGEIEIAAMGQTAQGSALMHAYLTAATIYTFTPLQFAFLIKGNQNLTGNVAINTGSSSITVLGNLSISGSANITGAANATGTITGCTSTAVCTSGISADNIPSPAIDVYNLSSEANAVLSVDANGNPEVTFQNDTALQPAGTMLLANVPSTSTALCEAGGSSCIAPPSSFNGAWEITSTPNPGVLFFYGDLTVAAGVIGTASSSVPGYATLLATGNMLIDTNNDIVSYGQMPNVCNQTVVPTNVCPDGPTTANNGEGIGAVANAVVISGGNVTYPYSSGAPVYVNGAVATGVPPNGATTETTASNTVEPSGTVTGFECSSNGNSIGTSGSCPSGSTTNAVLTGGDVTLKGNSDLTGVVAASESLTAIGTGTITGMIDTADTNNLSSSTLGDTTSTNDVNGNLNIQYSPGVSNMTNFGGGGNTAAMAFTPLWQHYIY